MDNNSPIQPEYRPPEMNLGASFVQGAEQQQPRPSRRKFKLIVIVLCLLLLVGGGLTFWFINRKPLCLDDQDYRSITGVDRDDPLSAQTSFLSEIIYFKPDSAEYDYTSSLTDGVLNNISTYAATHKDKSIIATISADYYSDSQLRVTNQRMQTIRADLIAAGMEPASVIMADPTPITADDTESGDGTINSPVTITITSDAMCR